MTVSKADELAEEEKSQLDNAADMVSSAVEAAVEKGREAAGQIKNAAEDVHASVDDLIRKKPLTALGIAIVNGFVLGALSKI